LFFRFQLYQFPRDIATRKVEIPANWQAFLSDLEARGGPECIFKTFEIAEAVFRHWLGPEKRSERPAMHSARGGVVFDREYQSINLRTPANPIVQDLSRSSKT
jgi:hypothetical protein